MMHRDFGFTAADLRQCLQNGLRAAWVDETTRKQWLQKDLEKFDGLLN